jgi:uncharacterized membrane protein
MNNPIINCSLKRMMSGFCSTAVIACFVLGGSVAFAQTSYKVTDLGVLPGKEESIPAAINNQGLIAGTSSARASGEAAFRYNPYNPALMEDIGQSLRGFISRGFGIKNTGAVVGDSSFSPVPNTDASPCSKTEIRDSLLLPTKNLVDRAIRE